MGDTYVCGLSVRGPKEDLGDFKQANRGCPRDQWEKDAGREVLDFCSMVPADPHGCKALVLAKLVGNDDDTIIYDYVVENGNSKEWVQAVSRLWPNLRFTLLAETNGSHYQGYGQRFLIWRGRSACSDLVQSEREGYVARSSAETSTGAKDGWLILYAAEKEAADIASEKSIVETFSQILRTPDDLVSFVKGRLYGGHNPSPDMFAYDAFMAMKIEASASVFDFEMALLMVMEELRQSNALVRWGGSVAELMGLDESFAQKLRREFRGRDDASPIAGSERDAFLSHLGILC